MKKPRQEYNTNDALALARDVCAREPDPRDVTDLVASIAMSHLSAGQAVVRDYLRHHLGALIDPVMSWFEAHTKNGLAAKPLLEAALLARTDGVMLPMVSFHLFEAVRNIQPTRSKKSADDQFSAATTPLSYVLEDMGLQLRSTGSLLHATTGWSLTSRGLSWDKSQDPPSLRSDSPIVLGRRLDADLGNCMGMARAVRRVCLKHRGARANDGEIHTLSRSLYRVGLDQEVIANPVQWGRARDTYNPPYGAAIGPGITIWPRTPRTPVRIEAAGMASVDLSEVPDAVLAQLVAHPMRGVPIYVAWSGDWRETLHWGLDPSEVDAAATRSDGDPHRPRTGHLFGIEVHYDPYLPADRGGIRFIPEETTRRTIAQTELTSIAGRVVKAALYKDPQLHCRAPDCPACQGRGKMVVGGGKQPLTTTNQPCFYNIISEACRDPAR